MLVPVGCGEEFSEEDMLSADEYETQELWVTLRAGEDKTVDVKLKRVPPKQPEINTIRLICKYSHTIDENGKSSRTSGEDLVTVHFTDSGDAYIKVGVLGAVFIGTISDEEIYGETTYSIKAQTYYQTLTINRYTGAFQNTFRVNESGGLIHYGNCKSVTEKKF